MANPKLKRIVRPMTEAEKKRHAEIRAKVMQEFPPLAMAHSVEAVCDVAVSPKDAK